MELLCLNNHYPSAVSFCFCRQAARPCALGDYFHFAANPSFYVDSVFSVVRNIFAARVHGLAVGKQIFVSPCSGIGGFSNCRPCYIYPHLVGSCRLFYA